MPPSERKRERTGLSGERDKAGIKRLKGENFYRDAKKVRQVNLLRGGHATRDSQGNITQAAAFQSREKPKARVQPDRRWFGNTRVIAQNALTQFRENMEAKSSDPYSVLLQRNKLPMSLLKPNERIPKVKVVQSEPYKTTFGPSAQRKRPKLKVGSMEEMATSTYEEAEAFTERADAATGEIDDYSQEAREAVFFKGQSRRIWNELYKVIDSSDVIIHVLDARDPLGTRCKSVEQYLKNDAPHKHLIFVLNKCDLVPTRVTVSLSLSQLFCVVQSYCQDPFPSTMPNCSTLRLHAVPGRPIAMEVELLQLWHIDALDRVTRLEFFNTRPRDDPTRL